MEDAKDMKESAPPDSSLEPKVSSPNEDQSHNAAQTSQHTSEKLQNSKIQEAAVDASEHLKDASHSLLLQESQTSPEGNLMSAASIKSNGVSDISETGTPEMASGTPMVQPEASLQSIQDLKVDPSANRNTTALGESNVSSTLDVKPSEMLEPAVDIGANRKVHNQPNDFSDGPRAKQDSSSIVAVNSETSPLKGEKAKNTTVSEMQL